MNVLILGALQDLKDKIFNKTLLESSIDKLKESKHIVKVFSRYTDVRNLLSNDILIRTPDLKRALESFKKGKESFVLMTKLAISNIDYTKLLQYHTNHKYNITIVCRNLVQGKAIPLYKLNQNKEVISINKKRYASCGIYVFNSNVDFNNLKTLNSFIEQQVEKRNVKAFVHAGYFFRKKQEFSGIDQRLKQRKFIGENNG